METLSEIILAQTSGEDCTEAYLSDSMDLYISTAEPSMPSLTRPEDHMDKVKSIFPRAKAAKDGWTLELTFDEE